MQSTRSTGRAPGSGRGKPGRISPASFGPIAVFLAVAVLWGIPYALIKVALDHHADPLLIAFVRVAIGAALLSAVAVRQSAFRGMRRHLWALGAVAVCDIAAPLSLLPIAERRLSSSLAGILVASTPLFVGVLGPALGAGARPGTRGWAGLLAGFAGVIALLGLDLTGSLPAAAAVLLAALGYGVASLIIDTHLGDIAPLGVGAAALGIATVMLAPGAIVSLPSAASGSAWTAMLALGVLCTAAAFGLYYMLIAHVGATRAALTTYLSPIFSILAGAAFLAENITIAAVAGVVLILTGSWLTTTDPHTDRDQDGTPPDAARATAETASAPPSIDLSCR